METSDVVQSTGLLMDAATSVSGAVKNSDSVVTLAPVTDVQEHDRKNTNASEIAPIRASNHCIDAPIQQSTIAPIIASPPQIKRNGVLTFSIDSLLFNVFKKETHQSPSTSNEKIALETSDMPLAESGKPNETNITAREQVPEQQEEKPFAASLELPKPTVAVMPANEAADAIALFLDTSTNLISPAESASERGNIVVTTTAVNLKDVEKIPTLPLETEMQKVSLGEKEADQKKEEEIPILPKSQEDAQTSIPTATTPATSSSVSNNVFKTPSPVAKRGRPRTVPRLVPQLLPSPPPTKEEEEVKIEETKVTREETPKNTIEDHSVDLIFLALIGEDVTEAPRMNKSLNDLVLEKKIQLESSACTESSNTGEDLRYMTADLKKLKAEVDEEMSRLNFSTSSCNLSPSAKGAIKLLAKVGAKRGRKPKKVANNSDTDTDTFSTGDIEDAEYQKLIKEDLDEKMATSSNTPSSSNSSRFSSQTARKRQAEQPTTSDVEPKARRSERIQKRGGSFYKSAVTAYLDSDDYIQAEDYNTSDEHSSSTSSESKSKKASPKPKASSSKKDEREVEEPPLQPQEPPKKTRASVRAEYYEKRNNNDPIIMKMLEQVKTPMPTQEDDILDHFQYPVIRRAIVNKNTLCYAISMLQLMLRVPQIYSIVKCHTHEDGLKHEDCFLCLLGDIISSRPCLDEYPIFVDLMKKTWKGVEVDVMHCVMEAMQKFFNRFDEDYLKEHPEYAARMPLGFSPVRSIFEIQLMNEYCCSICNYTNHGIDKAIYLSIDLTKRSDGTMQNLVDNIRNPTAVYGMDCPLCLGTKFICTTLFHKLPEVLLYFVPRVRTKKREKDMTVVQIQHELVLKDAEKEHKYALCSFITHCGLTGNKGHYKQYEVDRSDGIKFNEFDDARVTLNAKLSRDITVVLAMFRKESAVAKDAPTDIIFDGRGNVSYSHPRHGHKP